LFVGRQQAKRYWRPPSSANGSPSKSTNISNREGSGKAVESGSLDDGEQFVNRLLRGSCLDLDAGLFADALDAFSRAVKGFLLQRERQYGEFGHGWRVPGFQLDSLLVSDSRDE